MPSLTLASALVALLLPFAAVAQEPAAIATMEQSAELHAAAERYWRGYESGLSTHCVNVAIDWSKAAHRVYGKPETAPDGKLVNALWIETVPGAACGETRRYRVLITAIKGVRSLQPIYPGESITSPTLQDEVMLHLPSATKSFIPQGQTCKVDVLDTKLIGGMPINLRAAWNEGWTVRVCGKRLNVPIRFVPDATGPGTSVQLSAKAITVVP